MGAKGKKQANTSQSYAKYWRLLLGRHADELIAQAYHDAELFKRGELTE